MAEAKEETPLGDVRIKWIRPSGSEITTNAFPATIRKATAEGWKPADKDNEADAKKAGYVAPKESK